MHIPFIVVTIVMSVVVAEGIGTVICLKSENFRFGRNDRVGHQEYNKRRLLRRRLNVIFVFALSVNLSMFSVSAINWNIPAGGRFDELCKLSDISVKKTKYWEKLYMDLDCTSGQVRHYLRKNESLTQSVGGYINITFQPGVLGFTRIVSIDRRL